MQICPRCLRSFPDTERFCPKDGSDLVDADDVSRNAANATYDALPADLGAEARRNVFERRENPTVELARKELEARLARAEAARAGRTPGRGIGPAVAVVGVVLVAMAIAAAFFVLLAPAPRAVVPAGAAAPAGGAAPGGPAPAPGLAPAPTAPPVPTAPAAD